MNTFVALTEDCIRYFVSPPAFLEVSISVLGVASGAAAVALTSNQDNAEESRGTLHLAGRK